MSSNFSSAVYRPVTASHVAALSSLFHLASVAYPGILFVGGVQQIQLRTEDRENGDLGPVAP